MPAMVCATLGIDLTYTLSSIFLTSVQPPRYQGLSGAISSVVVNLGISFFLMFADIVQTATEGRGTVSSFRAVFWFGTSLAGAGFLICVLFVRIPRKLGDPPVKGHASSSATHVEGRTASLPKNVLSEKSTPNKLRKKALTQAEVDRWCIKP